MSYTHQTFEGRDVIGEEVAVANPTAASNREDPYQIGDVVYVVCKATVGKVTHRTDKDSTYLTRVATAKPVEVAIVEVDDLYDVLETIRIRTETAEGIQRLELEQTT